MADLLIKEAELRQLDQIVGQIPTAYGVNIVNFLNFIANERNKEANVKAPDEASKEVPKLKALPSKLKVSPVTENPQ